MGFIHVAVAVLSLLSGGQSAPVTSCENLIQPIQIQGRDQVKRFHVTCHSRARFLHVGSSSKSFNVMICHLMRLTGDSVCFSAVGQVDKYRRKHKHPRIQVADEDVCGEQLGESHCC